MNNVFVILTSVWEQIENTIISSTGLTVLTRRLILTAEGLH